MGDSLDYKKKYKEMKKRLKQLIYVSFVISLPLSDMHTGRIFAGGRTLKIWNLPYSLVLEKSSMPYVFEYLRNGWDESLVIH